MITASIVLYKTKQFQIEDILKSLEDSHCLDKLFVIDNLPTDSNKEFFSNCSLADIIEYIPHENTGYGSSHNIAMRKSVEMHADYHLILNPDIRFEGDVISGLVKYMDNNTDVVYVLPKVVYPDGSLQYLCKLLPSPVQMFLRRFVSHSKWSKKIDNRYTLKHSGYDFIMNPPCLSGCFMMLRNSVIGKNCLYFDDHFFMYFEDFDLIRRLHRVGKTVYNPNFTIIHDHAQESYKSIKMLLVHIKSAIRYFNKYGWFIDGERKRMNNQILKEIQITLNEKNSLS